MKGKCLFVFIIFYFNTELKSQYVGINTTEPRATLDIVSAPDNAAIADGLLLPSLTLAQLMAKTAYTEIHAGTVVYISNANGSNDDFSTSLITTPGQYYFDGEQWKSSTQASIKNPKLKNTFGPGSGNLNDKGVRNTAFGQDALISSVNDSDNSAYGVGALKNSSSGSSNTAVGYNALSNQETAGSHNTAVGVASLFNNTGSQNTAVGKNALDKNNGNDNTAIGFQSGRGIENGSGNVAIGANSGAAKDVSNTVALGVGATVTKSDQIVLGSESNKELIVFGTIKSDDKLVYFSDPEKQNYFMAGAGRENFDNMSNLSYGNTAVGHNALAEVDNSMMNTAVGFQALQNLRNGADNTAFGAGALRNQLGGVGNSALGRLALANSAEGTNNTGLGDTALEFTLGSQNTAVGYSAGIKAVSGNFNSFFGVFAGGHYLGRNAPDGTFSYCNVFGAESMQVNENGSSNNLFGYRAGHVLTGSDNAGFGHEVFRHLQNGERNTALGNYSSWTLTDGSDNVFIGYEAGKNGAQKADAAGSTVIGSYAFSTRDNEVVIGKPNDTHITLLGVEFTREELLLLKTLLSEKLQGK